MPESTSEAAAAAVFDVLRQVLKQRRMTYRDLAERLEMSESGVKKMFAQRNCSLDRLATMAAVLDIPLSELVALSEKPAIRHVTLGEEQQRWLLEHPLTFAFYWKLAIERWSPAAIATAFGLDAAERRRQLSLLDDLGLIALEAGDRVRVGGKGDLVRWRDDGPLMAHLNRRWSAELLDDLLDPPEGVRRPGHLLRLTFVELRPETARELRDALEQLVDEFARRARYEKATSSPDALEPLRLLLASCGGSFVPDQGPGGG